MNRELGYNATHTHLRRERGSAGLEQCALCYGEATDWAYDHSGVEERTDRRLGSGRLYSLNLSHYIPLCRKCHTWLDATVTPNRRRFTTCRNGHPTTEENIYTYPTTGKRMCRECFRLRYQRYQKKRQGK